MCDLSNIPVTVLLAEDDLGDQKVTKRAFAEAGIDCDLRIVEDGEEALDYLLRRDKYQDPGKSPLPDLVLLDLNMPKLSGLEVLEQVRQYPELSRLRIVVLTTSDHEQDVMNSYNSGATSFITKPVSYKDFVEVVKALCVYWFQVVVLPPVRI